MLMHIPFLWGGSGTINLWKHELFYCSDEVVLFNLKDVLDFSWSLLGCENQIELITTVPSRFHSMLQLYQVSHLVQVICIYIIATWNWQQSLEAFNIQTQKSEPIITSIWAARVTGAGNHQLWFQTHSQCFSSALTHFEWKKVKICIHYSNNGYEEKAKCCLGDGLHFSGWFLCLVAEKIA